MKGPVQVLVVGFDQPVFSGEVLAEFARLREAGIVRLIDLMLVSRTVNGAIETLDAPAGLGADVGEVAAELFGRPDDAVPDEATAADDAAEASECGSGEEQRWFWLSPDLRSRSASPLPAPPTPAARVPLAHPPPAPIPPFSLPPPMSFR